MEIATPKSTDQPLSNEEILEEIKVVRRETEGKRGM